MKIVVFGPDRRVGAISGNTVIDLNLAAARLQRERGGAGLPSTLLGLIDGGAAALEVAMLAIGHALGNDPKDGAATIVHDLATVQLHAPWPGKRIVCAGGNYAEHAYGMALNRGVEGITLETMAQKIRTDGNWGFWKSLDDVAGPGQDVPYPSRVKYFDYEGEAVVVLGKRGKNVKASEIGNYVWGVTLGNDWSNRDHEPGPQRTVSYNLQKNFDYAASLGPCILVGEVDHQNVAVETRLNGELRQKFNSKDMVFSFGELLEYLSRDFTFAPGDLIFGGTGAGTASDTTKNNPDGTRPHDRFLNVGDVVEISSPQIGSLSNRLVAG